MCGLVVLWIFAVFLLASISETVAVGFVLFSFGVWLLGKAVRGLNEGSRR
jgi:hypothetical protein